jgi:hypothetical protein
MDAMQNSTSTRPKAQVGGAWGRGLAGTARPFYASIGPGRGPLIYSEALLAIGVTKRWRGGKPIGAAVCVGRDQTGVALWELTVGRVEVPGRFVLIDRQFRRPESSPRECSPV